MRWVRLKVCGITSAEDARAAISGGADALGFVLAGGPRQVTPEHLKTLTANLPPLVTRVGVFANHELGEVERILRECGIDRAQLHGDEDPAFVRSLGGRAYKAFRLRDGQDGMIEEIGRYPSGTVLLDAHVEGQLGGTGKTCDWSLAARVAARTPVILAGGLRPDNVVEAIRIVQPWAVDLSSGVERRPGEKDPAKLRELSHALDRSG